MIVETSIALLALLVVIFTIIYCRDKVSKEKSKISIKESLELAQLPIITLYEGNNKLNFLLDSGSSHSHICKNIVDKLSGNKHSTDYNFVTASGESSNSEIIKCTLRYKKEFFMVDLFVNEGLIDAFKSVKKECGVQLHGILGTDFLKDHKYILDFAELVAYHK